MIVSILSHDSLSDVFSLLKFYFKGTTMKQISLIVLTISSIALMGCQQWVSDGTVEMDKLIALDSLWAKADQYIGKQVTIELDSGISGRLDGTAPIQGKSYNAISFLISNDSLGHSWDSIYAFLKNRGIDTSKADTVYIGSYALSFIADARMGDTLDKPHWIEYVGKILNFARQFRKKGATEQVSSNIERAPHKYITGFLMLKDSSDHHTFPDTKTTEIERIFVIAPTGYKYLKE